MYCPQCRVEYREGFTECADCHTTLLAGAPAPLPDRFDPALGLAIVLETNDAIQLALAKGLLDDARIPYFVLGQIATLVQDVDPFLRKAFRIQVPADRESEARDLLAPLLEPDPTALEPGEDAAAPR